MGDINLSNFSNLSYDCIGNKVLFVVWTGTNPMSENRKHSIKTLKEKSGLTVVCINPQNINQIILPNYPFHEAYQYLSLTHKADYLRCYLMHHYGGGYSDIKPTTGSWVELFDEIRHKHETWVIGYKVDSIAYPDESTEEERNILNNNLNKLIGVGFFICKPYSPFTTEWYKTLHKRLDFYLEELRKFPGRFPRESKDGSPCPSWEGGVVDKVYKYPIGWNRILGQIVYPLELKYLDHIKKGIPDWNGYYM